MKRKEKKLLSMDEYEDMDDDALEAEWKALEEEGELVAAELRATSPESDNRAERLSYCKAVMNAAYFCWRVLQARGELERAG